MTSLDDKKNTISKFESFNDEKLKEELEEKATHYKTEALELLKKEADDRKLTYTLLTAKTERKTMQEETKKHRVPFIITFSIIYLLISYLFYFKLSYQRPGSGGLFIRFLGALTVEQVFIVVISAIIFFLIRPIVKLWVRLNKK